MNTKEIFMLWLKVAFVTLGFVAMLLAMLLAAALIG